MTMLMVRIPRNAVNHPICAHETTCGVASKSVGAEGVYEPDEYRRSQDYTRATTRFRFVTGIFQLLLLLGFWFAGGFNYLDQVVRSWGFVSIANGL